MTYLKQEDAHAAREAAFKIIYQWDMGDGNEELAIETMLEEGELTAGNEEFCRKIVQGVQENQEAIDKFIQENAKGWSLGRMMSVDRNLLRLAAYEIKFANHISAIGAINEAVELAKVYGDDKSPAFINSILDKIMKR